MCEKYMLIAMKLFALFTFALAIDKGNITLFVLGLIIIGIYCYLVLPEEKRQNTLVAVKAMKRKWFKNETEIKEHPTLPELPTIKEAQTSDSNVPEGSASFTQQHDDEYNMLVAMKRKSFKNKTEIKEHPTLPLPTIKEAQTSDSNVPDGSASFIQQHDDEYNMLVDEWNWQLKLSTILELNSLPLPHVERATKFDNYILKVSEELRQLHAKLQEESREQLPFSRELADLHSTELREIQPKYMKLYEREIEEMELDDTEPEDMELDDTELEAMELDE
ncbi:hypothetical protein JTE90_001421 [Oedothorax gibbosus]|uniref:Transmembrane protein n=1 Tax=Oedothorax gibbosus TaxID=931172 RepID=A0AAV6VFB7_9ARAC|nr:hypothetical protein JTE90_001421 [Oedothorax gibbosus]